MPIPTEVIETVAVAKEAVEKEEVTFMTWVDSGFEEQALGEMVDYFEAAYGIQVILVIEP